MVNRIVEEAGPFSELAIQASVQGDTVHTIYGTEDSVLLDAITTRQDGPILPSFFISATVATTFLLSHTLRYLRQGIYNLFL